MTGLQRDGGRWDHPCGHLGSGRRVFDVAIGDLNVVERTLGPLWTLRQGVSCDRAGLFARSTDVHP